MRHPLRLIVAGVLATLLMATAAMPADRAAITTKVRAELARLLKKEAATLPTDKPVVELGADDLTVVEWVMALDEAYRIRIPDSVTTEPKSRTTRKDLTIASMVNFVVTEVDRPKK